MGSQNRIPTADAGKTMDFGGCAGNPVQLNGYGSFDPDGDRLTYAWALVSAPTDSAATDAILQMYPVQILTLLGMRLVPTHSSCRYTMALHGLHQTWWT